MNIVNILTILNGSIIIGLGIFLTSVNPYVGWILPVILMGMLIKIRKKMKLKKHTLHYYDYFDMKKLVEEKLGFNIRNCGKHFHPDTMTFNQWCDHRKLPKKDSIGKTRVKSSLFYKQFTKEVSDGTIKEVPYLDFWHWQLKNCIPDNMHNGSYSTLYIGMNFYNYTPELWQFQIQKVWNDLFKDIADEEGSINVLYDW